MVEITPEFSEKSRRMRALKADQSATAREAIDLFLWFQTYDSRVLDDEKAGIVLAVLERTGLTPDLKAELMERCLRGVMNANWSNAKYAWEQLAEFVLKS